MSLITIDQLLESVDLDFEPRWVTKDKDGCISLFSHKPDFCSGCYHQWRESDSEDPKHKQSMLGALKLAEFENKPWSECIYEVPRKATGKIERLEPLNGLQHNWLDKINEIIDWINENYKDAK